MKKILFLIFLALLTNNIQVQAQRVAIKTNALYWAAMSPNMGLEFRVSRRFTVNLEAAANPFNGIGPIRTRFGGFTPEVRYWFEGRPHSHHFIGAMGLASVYSLKFDDTCHDGTAAGIGLTYGYSFILGNRWSLETTIGAGAMHTHERKYAVGTAPADRIYRDKFVFAPMKIGVSFVYLIK